MKNFILFLVILSAGSTSIAYPTIRNHHSDTEKKFLVKVSVDNNLKSSQEASTDLALSAISGLAYINHHYNRSDNIFYRLGLGYGAFLTTLINHEISGHGLRAVELKGKIKNINISPLSGSVSYYSPKPYHIQKEALISLAGNETNYLLSQKIANNIIKTDHKIDPITGFGYIFSGGNQLFYTYLSGKATDGHDLKSYSRDMEAMYGNKSMTLKKIESSGFLDLLDPILIASIYSAATGNIVEIPMIKLNNFGFTPYARSILTPFNVIEKKVGLYIFTDYTPVKIGFSFGKQNKTDKRIIATRDEQGRFRYLKQKGIINDISDTGLFTGLKNGETVKKHTSYSADISIYKLYEMDKLIVGLDGVFWRQPELLVKDAYRAKPKNGWMLVLNNAYQLKKDLNLTMRAGYKTKGFVLGQHLDKTAIISVGCECQI